MCLACWTAGVAAVHPHLREVGMYGGASCLPDQRIRRMLSYPLFNASNLHF